MAGLTITVRPKPATFFEDRKKFFAQYPDKAVLTHLKWVFRVMEYTVKYSRVETGRSRAAWFPIMDFYGFNYQRSLAGQRTDPSAVEEGYAMGSYDSQPFNTTITNNVEYADIMNRRFGLFGFSPMTSGKMKLGSREGIRFEEKIPLFEQYGFDTWSDFFTACQGAWDNGGEIADVEVPPPMAP